MTASAEIRNGRLLSGVETLGELLVARRVLDERDGLDTATFVSGYPGSPLGGVDLALGRLGDRLATHRIVHRPGLNEELAAAAVWGSQMGAAVPYEGLDGVVGAWYGKGPGLDRCGDVLKHASLMGTGPGGGAVLFVGDDPSAKSSTLPYDTNLALADACVPVLVPGDQQDLFDLGIAAFRLSRFCGSWVGVRIVTAVADGIGSVDTTVGRFPASPADDPDVEIDGEPWRHVPARQIVGAGAAGLEELWLDRRLRAAQGWVAARGLDRATGAAPGEARLGIVCAGKTHRDVLGALDACGVAPGDLAVAGIRVLRLAMTFPVVPQRILELCDAVGDTGEILVVEEKRPFVEQQVRAIVQEAQRTTRVRGKRDGAGKPLVPVAGELTAERIVPVLTQVVPDLLPSPPSLPSLPSPPGSPGRSTPAPAGPAPGRPRGRAPLPLADLPGRTPAFCSGCPHNRSTVVPVGSITGGGVGCHGMIHFEPRHAGETFVPPTPMGAEGAHWIGLAPFVGDRHLFQNLGDGTFSHSGSLAIRACVAAGVHITFKLLYNSAVAMTGGQDITGLMDVPALTRALAADGVTAIAVCTDDVHRYGRGASFAPGVRVRHRDDVVEVQEELRRSPGVSVLVYDQRCAAEARRLRKRGLLEDPTTRVVINQAVCEGCGHCSQVSNCLSVLPVETELGERREIHQSSCNKDYSCIDGDCPSFVTFVPATRRRSPFRRRSVRRDEPSAARTKLPPGTLPDPVITPLDGRFSVYTTGIGGTGVVTANRLLARAAVIAGHTVQGVDQTGLSQKAGAVVSHLHIAPAGADITTATVADGAADLYLSGDILQAASPVHLRKVVSGRTVAVVDAALVPTATMLQTDGGLDAGRLAAALVEAVGEDRTLLADSTGLAETVLGSHLPANVVLLGAAFQLGALPLPFDALDAAIAEQGAAAAMNREAFAWGRWLAADRTAVEAALGRGGARTNGSGGGGRRSQSALWDPTARSAARAPALVEGLKVPPELRPLLERRAAQLLDYQGPGVARRWLDLVERAAAADDDKQRFALTEAVAEGWYKLLTYKDEYEVARLHLRLDLDEVAAELGFGDGYRARYMLHPPTLRRFGLERKIGVGGRTGRLAFRALAAVRRVRGTPLDLFGYARHRREERRVAEEYAGLVSTAIAGLTADGYDDAVALARSADTIRGYEDIKSAAVERWRATATATPNASVHSE
jgi:indolepyruvate ferredoxin oxidoreductase